MRTCDYCGRENPDDAANCSGCASQLQEEPPVVKRTKAGFWLRAAARILDTIFIFILAFMTQVIFNFVLVILTQADLISPGWQFRLHAFSVALLIFGALASLGYHGFCEGLFGATLGKLCCGLRVISEDGDRAI